MEIGILQQNFAVAQGKAEGKNAAVKCGNGGNGG